MEQQELDQVAEYAKKLGALGDSPVRHWSFEAEHVGIARARSNANYRDYVPFSFVIDGSVDTEFDYCDCSCRDCQYHECNCDNCEDYNDSPDHCADESCTANEFSPSRPLATVWNEEFTPFIEACSESAERYSYENYARLGGHVHVEARDLTRRQAVNAVIIAEHVFRIAPEWFTGEHDDYNSQNDRPSLAEWATGKGSARRDTWASLSNLNWQKDPMSYTVGAEWDRCKTTIELRRFRTTFSPDILKIRGGFARALVAYAKTDAPIYWATRSSNFAEVMAELGFGKH